MKRSQEVGNIASKSAVIYQVFILFYEQRFLFKNCIWSNISPCHWLDSAFYMASRALLKSPNIWTVIKPRLLLSVRKLQPKPRSFGFKMQNMQWHCLKNVVVRRFSITWATKPRKDSRVGLKVLTTAIMIISLPNTETEQQLSQNIITL